MTQRERFLRTMHYQPVDHVPDHEFGYWDDTLLLWHEQGLPKEIDSNAKADVYFGFERSTWVPYHTGLLYGFERKILEDRGDHLLIQDDTGATCIVHKSGQSSIPHFIDFPLKGRKEFEEVFKARLDPDSPGRYPTPEQITAWRGRVDPDLPVHIGIGSLYGWIRDWMGFERAAMMVYDDPGLVEEIMERLTVISVRLIEAVGPYLQIDFGAGWEDMCFRNGPMISPATFERLMVPRYTRITDALKKYGCDICYTDCDGNITHLVSLWLKAGVNGMFPVEVAAGSDPLVLREKYGKEVLLFGGVNKRSLALGKEAIRSEIDRIAPVVREGGWIPHVDHRVPPDVTFENYLYYLAAKRDTFEIPEPAPWEERRPADWGPAK